MGSPRHLHRLTLVVCVVAAFLAGVVLLPAAGLLMLSPALALIALVALGLFPDERVVGALRRRWTARRVLAPRPQAPALRPLLRPAGLALAFALAVRPPPTAASFTLRA